MFWVQGYKLDDALSLLQVNICFSLIVSSLLDKRIVTFITNNFLFVVLFELSCNYHLFEYLFKVHVFWTLKLRLLMLMYLPAFLSMQKNRPCFPKVDAIKSATGDIVRHSLTHIQQVPQSYAWWKITRNKITVSEYDFP